MQDNNIMSIYSHALQDDCSFVLYRIIASNIIKRKREKKNKINALLTCGVIIRACSCGSTNQEEFSIKANGMETYYLSMYDYLDELHKVMNMATTV